MVALWLLLTLVWAQDPEPDASVGVGEPPAGPALTDPAEVQALTLSISRGLRCPVCQGLSVGDSQSEAAVAMKLRVQELVQAGYTEDQIVAYFVARYGTWVLLEPPREGMNTLLFVGPGLLVVAGLGAWLLRARRREPEPTPALPTGEDPYRRRVLDELER